MAPVLPPLSDAKFSLNAWGVAGIFGGEEAISAMSMIPLYQGRRWLGWYNSPGSLFVARHFGRLTQSAFWRQIFPYSSKSPAALFGFDGKKGPKYIAALSGTKMRTGHLGHLAVERCLEMKDSEVTEIEGRKTLPTDVALIELHSELVDYDHTVPRISFANTLLALFPIFVSIVTCVMCALYQDWYNFSVIATGILASGFASITIGSAKLSLRSVTKPAASAPPGHGVLIADDIVVVVKGSEPAVNAITKGRFALELGSPWLHNAVGVCSLFLIVEFLAQLLLIPQGTLFGQIMFVTSLCVSWGYNFHLSSYRREKLQADILFLKLGDPKIRKFRAGTRTTMVTLVAIFLFNGVNTPPPDAVEKILHRFLPNDTPVWNMWRQKVTRQICDRFSSHLQTDEDKGLADDQLRLLGTLLGDSQAAFDWFSKEYTYI